MWCKPQKNNFGFLDQPPDPEEGDPLKCGDDDLVCCKTFNSIPDDFKEVYISQDNPNFCQILDGGSCKRKQLCGKEGKIITLVTHTYT